MDAREIETTLTDLFKGFSHIYELGNALDRQAGTIREISMNAAIASAQVASGSRVFSEMARQIGAISLALEKSVEAVRAISGHITNPMLSCLVSVGHLHKFADVLRRIPSEERERVTEVASEYERTIRRRVAEIRDQLHGMNAARSALLQVNARIWVLVVNLRVASNVTEEEDVRLFVSIANALEAMTFETAAILVDLGERVERLDSWASKTGYLKEARDGS